MRKVKWLWKPSIWASWKPFGIGEQRPNNYAELWRAFRVSKGRRKYAWRILRDGVCDGCALGTTGMKDWTVKGVHLCNIRLRLLRLNTAPAFDASLLADLTAFEAPDMRKSTALRGHGRIPEPLVRRRGDAGFSPISWDDALELVAQRIKGSTPDRMAFYMTSRGIPNETYYTVQKAVRAMGSNHVDNAARICHSPSTAGLKPTLGVSATTCSYTDWIGTDVVVFFGSNVANNQPVATKYLYQARKAGTRVVSVNNYREPGMERYWIPSIADSALFGTKLTTDFFGVNVGGDIAFINGALKAIIASERYDGEFIAGHTHGWEALVASVESMGWEALERQSGATRQEMEAFGGLIGGAERAVFVWSMGITQHVHGEDGVRAIVNLALSRGFVGREGCGVMPIRGHSGVQGGAEMGAYATVFPAGRPINAESAAELEGLWGFAPPTTKGMTGPEMVDAGGRGEIDMLWSIGGNYMEVLPDPDYIEAAVGRVPLRVHQDIILSPQMFIEPADVVLLLPATTRYEMPGGCTETSTERRVIFSPEIPGPRVPEARCEGDVLLDVARRVRPELRAALTFDGSAAVRAEIAKVVPFYAGIEALAEKGDQFQYGGPHLCADWVFPTPDGRATFIPAALPDMRPPRPGLMRVTTRRGKQFNSMVHEQRDRLNGVTRQAVLIAAEDAQRLGLRSGDPVRLKNANAEYLGVAAIAPLVPGNVQVHWPEGNALLDRDRRSPEVGIPDYNAWVEVTAAAG